MKASTIILIGLIISAISEFVIDSYSKSKGNAGYAYSFFWLGIVIVLIGIFIGIRNMLKKNKTHLNPKVKENEKHD